MVLVAEAEHALLGAALLLVAPSAAEGGVEAMHVERLLQPFGLPHVGVDRAVVEGIDALLLGFGVLVDDELDRRVRPDLVAQRVHVPELPGRVDMEQREGQRAREERLLGKMQHHRRILADRIEHHRAIGLGDRLAQDVNALGLEPIEMRE